MHRLADASRHATRDTPQRCLQPTAELVDADPPIRLEAISQTPQSSAPKYQPMRLQTQQLPASSRTKPPQRCSSEQAADCLNLSKQSPAQRHTLAAPALPPTPPTALAPLTPSPRPDTLTLSAPLLASDTNIGGCKSNIAEGIIHLDAYVYEYEYTEDVSM